MEIVERDHYFKARLSCRSDLSIPTIVKKRLKKNMNILFKKSCFGVFYDMTDLPFQGQLYLHFLFKQDSAQTGDKLIFHVNNQVTEFGPNEFTLITGLHFGSKSVIPESSKFYKAVFGRQPKLFVKDIRKAFMDATEKGSTCPEEDALKLGLLWILYGILLMKDYTTKRIDPKYIHLMDDLDAFNKFPWGRVAYDFLVTDIHSSMGRTATDRRKKHKLKGTTSAKEHMDLFGFAYVIQFWAYEVMPCVSKLCATRKSGSSLPRMLRWTCEKHYRFEVLTEKCFPVLKCGDDIGERLKVLPKLVPSKLEKNMFYYKSQVAWEKKIEPSSSNSRKRPRADFEDEENESKTKVKKKNRSNECSPSGFIDVKLLNMKVTEIQHTMKIILSNQQFIMGKMGWSIDGPEAEKEVETDGAEEVDEDETDGDEELEEGDETGQDEELEEGDETGEGEELEEGDENNEAEGADLNAKKLEEPDQSGVKEKLDETDEGRDADDSGKADEDEDNDENSDNETNVMGHINQERVVSDDIERVVDELMLEMAELERIKNEKEYQNWSLVVHKDSQSLVHDQLLDRVKYDPLDMIWPETVEDAFNTWYNASKGSQAGIEISVENIPVANHEFFALMWETKGWLEAKNIDAIFNLVILKSKKWPKLFEQEWTTVDQFFWGLFTETAYNAWAKAKRTKKHWDWNTYDRKVVEYVSGELPLHGQGLDWVDSERVYGVGHVNTNHWVLYEIRLQEGEIVVYDSLTGNGRRANPKTLSAFRRMATLMPSVCVDLLGRYQDPKTGNKSWTVTMSTQVPQQIDGDSCGILACKMFECLISGCSIEKIDPENVDKYRKSYCLELFDKNNIIL